MILARVAFFGSGSCRTDGIVHTHSLPLHSFDQIHVEIVNTVYPLINDLFFSKIISVLWVKTLTDEVFKSMMCYL